MLVNRGHCELLPERGRQAKSAFSPCRGYGPVFRRGERVARDIIADDEMGHMGDSGSLRGSWQQSLQGLEQIVQPHGTTEQTGRENEVAMPG